MTRIKTVVVPFTGATVSIPKTASGWELYSMKGSGLAASRLTKAMEKALLAPTHNEALEIMWSALNADRKYGSCDTEPRTIAVDILAKGRGEDFVSW